jgi:hypothetical protein
MELLGLRDMWKFKYVFLFGLMLTLAFLPLVFALNTTEVSTVDFIRFNVPLTGAFGVYHVDQNITIQLTVLTGTFLGNGTVTIDTFHGIVTYYSESDCSIHLSSSNSQVGFIINNVANDSMITASLLSGTNNVIEWNIPYSIWLPIHFAMGGLGLTFLCIVPVMAIKKFRQKDYVWTMVWGTVGILVGIALIIAWLWI